MDDFPGVRDALARGGNANAIDPSRHCETVPEAGMGALHIACENGSMEVVQCLVAAGADVNGLDGHKKLPFDYAVENNRDRVCHYLLSLKRGVEKARSDMGTPLHSALECRRIDIAAAVLAAGADVDQLAAFWWMDSECTALLRSVQGADAEVVRWLLERGARADKESGDHDLSPFTLAAAAGRRACVQLFLEFGYDPEYGGESGRSPMSVASSDIKPLLAAHVARQRLKDKQKPRAPRHREVLHG